MKDKSLILLLAAFALLVIMHNAATPVFEAPDEIWHHAYVRWLAQGRGLPAMDNDASGANQEVAQPPLYYAVAALLNTPFKNVDLEALLWGNPGFGHQAPGTIPDNKNMLIHTAQEAWPWRGAALSIHVTRLASLLFGLLTVLATWGLGYETFGNRRGARVAALLVAFHPQFVFMCSVISNDSAAAALSTATLWAVARTLRRGLTLRRAVACSALAGLAALTKTSAILLLPVAGSALLWAALRQILDRKRILVYSAAFVAAALLVGGWWYVRNGLLYGDLLGISNHANTPWGRPAPVGLLTLLPEMPRLVYSFWAAYGWGHVTWPAWVYWVLTLGTVVLFIRSLWNVAQMAQRAGKTRATQITLGILALALLWCGGIFAALLHWMRQVEAPHGRLLFPALGAWALFLANGVKRQEAGSKTRAPSPIRPFADALILLFFTLTALAPGARILATFAPPRLSAPTAVMNKLQPVGIDYAKQVRLLGIAVDTERTQPGDTFTVRACWEAIAPMSREYTVFVHLIGPENSRVAERHTYPGLGRFPTTLWPVGRAFCDNYRVSIEAWAEGPLLYRLEMGLFDTETGERLSAALADGRVYEPPVVGAVSVAPAHTPDTSPVHAVTATFDSQIALRGYDGPTTAQPGETVTVTLYWEALRAPDGDFTAFVHLWRPGDAAPLAQHDSPPRLGWYPTTVWQAGDRVPDTHPLDIPADLPPGEYPLWAGLYRTSDGIRLAADGSTGQYPNALAPLGLLKVATSR
ncbi:MAG TPA: glycosyltransferase family 39 protein [Anaerolineae bacterium]|nr:glycosyltransferase family 39 protein [Anaerolineae bacterium]HQI84741.1 glycosyltransferase family 39 protein [Anaerolineae bacterium]